MGVSFAGNEASGIFLEAWPKSTVGRWILYYGGWVTLSAINPPVVPFNKGEGKAHFPLFAKEGLGEIGERKRVAAKLALLIRIAILTVLVGSFSAVSRCACAHREPSVAERHINSEVTI